TPLPLSFAQQRLWFLDQVQPGSTLYSIPVVVRLTGPLNQAALVRAVETIVQRHEVLRTSFAYDPAIAAEPYQRIVPDWPQMLSLVVLPSDADEARIAQQVQRVVQQPFDFQQGPLFRAVLFQQSPTAHLLAWVIHHSIFDGWSQSVLLRELTELYQAFARGEEILIPPLAIQYGDYAVWQRQWLKGAVLDSQLDYWRRQLAGLTPLELPLDYPRPAVASDHGGLVAFSIPMDLATGLRQLSQKLGATLFMTLLAAWQTLLMRYSGQTDIAVGTPIAGRTRPELESLIGCFVNTLVLRSDLSGAPSVAELVARVRAVCLSAYAHQDLPFEVLVEAVQPERDLSRTPLFQVMFVLQNMPRTAIELPELIVEPLPGAHHTAKFDLLLAVSETEDVLAGAIEYRTDLFDAATIARMADHYLLLLAAMVADPEQPIDRLALLTEAERRLLTSQPALPPMARCIHELIATQAAHTPEAIAVQYQHETLTYQQLDQRANQLAHYLRSLGVGPERRVGVCLERSPDLVVALLGILKAGGAYVPLDPAYPQERLAFMVEDAAIAVLITHQALQPSLPAYAGPIVCLDRDAPLIAQQPITPPSVPSDPDQLMYIIYTSGSTGQPKGVLITHHMLSSYLWGVRAHYTIAPSDRLLQFASISFDASVEELFVPLTTGATVVLRTTEMLDSPQVFMDVCHTWRITVLSLPTAFWHVLAEALASETSTLPPSVRMVIIGGEQASSDLARRWQALVGQRVILANAYGPTETTIAATAYIVPAALPVAAGPIAIGQPLAHACAYVLDARMQLVPLGLPGELYIGGVQLARGYLNQPGLTAERFVPDPLSGIAGARLYKTGDRVRRRADGTLIFLGRVDQQIKLRGYRIELGEIEALLRQHEAVQDAVVTVREDKPGVQQLVAYVVENKGTKEQGNKEPKAEQRTKNKEQEDSF
ncbi:MAG: amino acid adenylation domain-containing protein, partial [Chloroflexi bacterium]|nr:amino acid adenylation domain-containing protein [Chloroflexota bacterium]